MHASDVLHSNLGSFKRTNFARGGDGLNTKYYLSSQCRTLEKENRVYHLFGKDNLVIDAEIISDEQ